MRFLSSALNDVVPEKNTCVSFVQAKDAKGPLARDLRAEDPDRVARVTAKICYGKVVVGITAAILVRFTLSLILARPTVTPNPSIPILAMALLLSSTS